MLEPYAYTSPARVKTLVVPMENTPTAQFEAYFNSSLSKYFEVRLVDLAPNGGMFNPQGFPHGRIIYDYQLSAPDAETMFLQDFEPFRKVFNVICIASHDQDVDFAAHLAKLRKDHSGSLHHSIIVFDTPNDVIDTLPKQPHVFYLGKDKKITALETVLCDITSGFLEALSSYASSFKHVTLRSPGSVASTEVSLPVVKKAQSYANGQSFAKISASASNSVSPSSTPSLTTEKKKKRISSASFLPNFDASNSAMAQERLKGAKIKGRQQKIMGNFYLLSGRLNDALRELCDAIPLLKQSSDYLWLGSALDSLGVCLVMLTFLEVPFQLPTAITAMVNVSNTTKKDVPSLHTPISSPRSSLNSINRTVSNQANSFSSSPLQSQTNTNSSTPPAVEFGMFNVSELATKIIGKAILYYKLTFDSIEDCVPQIVYCESVLRYVKFVTGLHINGGLDFRLLRHMVQNLPLTPDAAGEDLKAPYSVDKAQIASIEREIFTSQFHKLDFIHKARIYSCLISVSTDLALYRRRSLYLNQLFELITPLLSARKVDINANLSVVAKTGDISVAYERSEESILKLIDDVLTSYGVSLDSQKSPLLPNWVDLHLIELEKFIDLTEKLGFIDAAIRYASILLRNYAFALTPTEQNKLFNRIKRHAKQLKLTNSKFTLPYWDDFLARNVSSVAPISDLTPVKQNVLSDASTSASGVYNPFSTSDGDTGGELVTLVQEETSDLVVSLQNPFAFDIDVKNVEIACKDSFSVRTVAVFPTNPPAQQAETRLDFITIKPNQVVDACITFVPLQAGDMEIIGIRAKVCECDDRLFQISVSKDFKVHEKIKVTGVSRFVTGTTVPVLYRNDYDDIVTKTLKYRVLTAQPVLSTVGTSLLNRSIMLLEGETRPFTLSLKNNSAIEINHLASLFFDSTTEPLKKALSSKLPPNEIYEIEYYLFKKLPFKILTKGAELEDIAAHREITIPLSLHGKRGMTHGSVMLEYGNVQEGQELEYVRRTDIPINVSVYPSIEIASCDIIPLFSSDEIFQNNQQFLALKNRGTFWSYLYDRVAQHGDKLTDFCLLSLDLRNAWSQDLEINFSSSACELVDGDAVPVSGYADLDKCDIDEVIEKSKTERFLVPVNRIRLSEELLSKPVPSLRNKQYVVDSVTPAEEQKFVREAFWYRQELLKHLRGTWSVKGDGSRHGEIELRGIRFSSKMLNILKVDTVEIEQSIFKDDGVTKVAKSDSLTYALSLYESYSIKTKVTNNSGRSIRGMLRHVPMSKSTSISIDRKMLFNGVLQYYLPEELKPDASIEVSLSVCVLESGDFEWGTVFDELDTDAEGNLEERDSHTQRGSLFLVAA